MIPYDVLRRFHLMGAIVILVVALAPISSIADEVRPIPEIDALRMEKAQLEVQFLEERVARLKERAVRMLQDLQRRDGTEGWTLDLDNRKWMPPPKTESKETR